MERNSIYSIFDRLTILIDVVSFELLGQMSKIETFVLSIGVEVE